jgi:hypothetical protein
VTAGTGLTGGAASGPASLAIAPAYQMPQSCASGTSPQASGSNTWTCGTGLSKQFRFPSIASGDLESVTLGAFSVTLACASTAAVGADANGSVGGTVNFFYGQLVDSSSHDTGFAIAAGTGNTLAVNGGGTGSLVWDGDDGKVITGTITWFQRGPNGSCEFDGDLIAAAS